MKPFNKLTSTLLLAVTLLSSQCTKKNQVPDSPTDEQELITTFILQVQDSASGDTKSYFIKDPDGDGGLSAYYGPTAATQSDSVLQLKTNSTYYARIVLLDETKSPVDSISKEVEELGTEHMFFFNYQNSTIVNPTLPYTINLPESNMRITYLDGDNGSPNRSIGLHTSWHTSSIGRYRLNIVLRHQPNSKDGTYAPGETDIEVNFTYLIN